MRFYVGGAGDVREAVIDVAKIHPALLVLFLVYRQPNVLLDAKSLQHLLMERGFIVSRRMCYNYIHWLIREGYIYIIEDSRGKRVELTNKAECFLAQLLVGGEQCGEQ